MRSFVASSVSFVCPSDVRRVLGLPLCVRWTVQLQEERRTKLDTVEVSFQEKLIEFIGHLVTGTQCLNDWPASGLTFQSELLSSRFASVFNLLAQTWLVEWLFLTGHVTEGLSLEVKKKKSSSKSLLKKKLKCTKELSRLEVGGSRYLPTGCEAKKVAQRTLRKKSICTFERDCVVLSKCSNLWL